MSNLLTNHGAWHERRDQARPRRCAVGGPALLRLPLHDPLRLRESVRTRATRRALVFVLEGRGDRKVASVTELSSGN